MLIECKHSPICSLNYALSILPNNPLKYSKISSINDGTLWPWVTVPKPTRSRCKAAKKGLKPRPRAPESLSSSALLFDILHFGDSF